MEILLVHEMILGDAMQCYFTSHLLSLPASLFRLHFS